MGPCDRSSRPFYFQLFSRRVLCKTGKQLTEIGKKKGCLAVEAPTRGEEQRRTHRSLPKNKEWSYVCERVFAVALVGDGVPNAKNENTRQKQPLYIIPGCRGRGSNSSRSSNSTRSSDGSPSSRSSRSSSSDFDNVFFVSWSFRDVSCARSTPPTTLPTAHMTKAPKRIPWMLAFPRPRTTKTEQTGPGKLDPVHFFWQFLKCLPALTPQL